MNWSLLISALISFLKPLLQAWLEKILSDAESKLGLMSQQPEVALTDVFNEARKSLWWFQWLRRRQLDAAHRVAVKRASEIAAAARDGITPTLSGLEYDSIVNA